MIAAVLKTLLSGRFVCSVAYPTEYNYLSDPEALAKVEDVLGHMDLRLARTNPEDGAYYTAPKDVTTLSVTRLKEDLRRFRDVYGPAVMLLDLIRQTNSTEIALSPGDVIRLARMEELIIDSASLESQLNGLSHVIKGFNPRQSIRENFRKVLEQLRDEGYVILFNPQADIYKITGKIEHLYSVIEFISENEAIQADRIEDEVVEEQQTLGGMSDA
ncbi:condensin complex protein MksE [Cupriavidus taiwanensis]|uniref:Uncharacterized protein n=1 Tax=Cupriavidus taiwanensis TaxID=164546 RepID=A0A7Z7JGF8_9BURK|nr:hypothetical protein [Cupriavidus taiwanensis]SOZ19190.1 conserved hypothetical protein [Cupriavidus taiwanensis]SOZ97228.1 conserved hypothetical protein [Cupriavidus taiwanensis]SPC26121.1 conserved hypothetical protein [Cupriavidus taiwanensis]SPD37749.1 conserved protein of unknown function [Cupriavidus taiwanensis]